MKAINCTHCGATINDVSETSLLIHCEYCGARIMFQPERPAARPTQYVEPPELEVAEPSSPFNLIIGVVLVITFAPMLLLLLTPGKSKEPAQTKAYSVTSTPYTYPTPSSWSVSTNVPEKPIPVVITYYTAWVDENGRLNFRGDIYGHDARLAAKMFI